MSDCKQIDAQMMDWLYDELGSSDKARFDAHVDACARCQSEIDAFARTREAVRALPDEDPPPALSAILLHEAAKRTPPAGGRAPGVWAWLLGLFQPILAHPAAAALATLVLVVSVAGSLYLRAGRLETASPRAISDRGAAAGDSARAEPLAAEARAFDDPDPPSGAPSAADRRDRDSEIAAALEQGYRVDALDEKQKQSYGVIVDTAEPKLKTLDDDEIGREFAKRGDAQREDNLREGARGNREPARSMSRRDVPVANAVSSADLLLDEAEMDGFAQGAPADDAPVPGRAVRGREEARDATGSSKKVSGVAGQRVAGGVESDRSQVSVQRARKPEPKPADARAVASPDPRDKAPPGVSEKERAGADTAAGPASGGTSLAWARSTEQQMLQAIRRKDCRSAARLAADIFDRDRSYYSRNIQNAHAFRSCQAQFATEQRQRARRRAQKPKANRASEAQGDRPALSQ